MQQSVIITSSTPSIYFPSKFDTTTLIPFRNSSINCILSYKYYLPLHPIIKVPSSSRRVVRVFALGERSSWREMRMARRLFSAVLSIGLTPSLVLCFWLFGGLTADRVQSLLGWLLHTALGGKSERVYGPQQVHISTVGKDCIRITWITDDFEALSYVEYGEVSEKYELSATGESTSYSFFNYKSGKIHHVKIGPLKPNTIYYYRCSRVDPEFNFKTPPSYLPISFAIVGDLGQTEWTKSTLDHISKSNYDMLLLPGDLSYANTLQPLWDSFGRLVEPLASCRPWMVTHGNHEIEHVPMVIDEPFKAYNARWRMPYEESNSTTNLYYSFDVPGVHVIMLGSYADYNEGSAQYEWLKDDLEKVDRCETPWLIVLMHVPWYNTNLAHFGEGESMRRAMEKLLYKARVDMVFAGHVHAYERFTRVYNNEADPCGPIYVTIGDGGNREGLASYFKKQKSQLSLFREASFGHGRLTIIDNKRAHWEWQRNDDKDSTKADEVWIESHSSSTTCGSSTSKHEL